jgi:hypothetical protein
MILLPGLGGIMADEKVLPIKEVLGGVSSVDGQHILVKVKHAGGEAVLAFPKEEAFKCLEAIATGDFQSDKILNVPREMVRAYEATWFTIFGDKPNNPDEITLQMHFGEAKFAFHFPRAMARQMHEALSVLLGESTLRPSEGPLN